MSYKSRQVSVKPMKKSVLKKSHAIKRKHVEIYSESDVRQDVTDIRPSSQRRKITCKKVPANSPAAPLDNISFHFESSAQRWRFVYHRRIAIERELHVNALKCKEIMSLIQAAGLLKTVTGLGRCFDRLVKEFIVNVGPKVGEPGHM